MIIDEQNRNEAVYGVDGRDTRLQEGKWYPTYANMTPKAFLELQRKHWAIENNLHWVLDVTFKEDNLHARVEHIAFVLNLFRKLVLQLLKQDKTLSDSMVGKRKTCAWRFDLALNLLRAAQCPCDAR